MSDDGRFAEVSSGPTGTLHHGLHVDTSYLPRVATKFEGHTSHHRPELDSISKRFFQDVSPHHWQKNHSLLANPTLCQRLRGLPTMDNSREHMPTLKHVSNVFITMLAILAITRGDDGDPAAHTRQR